MTPHIEAKLGDYHSIVLMPGDPLRAKWIAENFLVNSKQVNSNKLPRNFPIYLKP